MTRTRPEWLALAWLLGVLAQLQQAQLAAAGVYALLLAVALALLLCARRWRRGAWLLLVALALLGFASTGWRAGVQQERSVLPDALQGQDVMVQGKVQGLPFAQSHALRFELHVQQAWRVADAAPVQLPAHLMLSWYGAQPETLRPGELWRMTLRLRSPHGTRNPHAYDAELRWWEQAVGAVGYVRTSRHDAPAQRLAPRSWYDLPSAIESWRQSVRQAIFGHLLRGSGAERAQQARVAGVLAALSMGEQGAISRADWATFGHTGVAHLMSISGLHITMLAWLAALLAQALWRVGARAGMRVCLYSSAWQTAMWCGAATALLYAAFSGWGVPAQRTVWMLTVAAVLRGSARQWPWVAVWACAGAAVALIQPWALLQAGFWLSFVAVGVLFAALGPRPSDAPAGGLAQRAWRATRHLLREQAVLSLSLAPLTLVLFGQVSLLGLGANLLAVPWVTLLLVPLTLAGMLCAPLWHGAAAAAQVLLDILGAMAQWPWSTYSAAQAPWWLAAAGVLGGLWMMLRLPLALRAAGALWLLPVLLWSAPRPQPGHFDVLGADVGQGSAVLIRTAQHSLLYDAGPAWSAQSDAGERILGPLLRALGERIDILMLSHGDSDHAGGATSVMRAQPQARLMGSLPENHALLPPGIAQQPCVAGQSWVWDGVRFTVLHPSAQDYAQRNNAHGNASSCVLRVDNAQRALLLTGDIGYAQEQRLIAGLDASLLRADLLLAAHHGSASSSSAAWLNAVQPRSTLIQAAWRNRYGHPARATIERLRAAGSAIIDTASCGAAHWRSTDAQTQCERHMHPHYWQHQPQPAGQ